MTKSSNHRTTAAVAESHTTEADRLARIQWVTVAVGVVAAAGAAVVIGLSLRSHS